MVDRLVEDILTGVKADVKDVKSAEQVKIEKMEKPILKLTDLEDVKRTESKDIEAEEEVWDWRRAYDKRGKARKR
jgi:hypothetical protein